MWLMKRKIIQDLVAWRKLTKFQSDIAPGSLLGVAIKRAHDSCGV